MPLLSTTGYILLSLMVQRKLEMTLLNSFTILTILERMSSLQIQIHLRILLQKQPSCESA